MNKEDLMIGDFVQKCGKIIFVNTLTQFGINTEESYGGIDYNIDYDDVEPIPLTTEFLLKNFGKPNYEFVTENVVNDKYKVADLGDIINIGYNFGYSVEDRRESMGKFSFCREDGTWICDLQHVHELQHALKLCKIDKTIQL